MTQTSGNGTEVGEVSGGCNRAGDVIRYTTVDYALRGLSAGNRVFVRRLRVRGRLNRRGRSCLLSSFFQAEKSSERVP